MPYLRRIIFLIAALAVAGCAASGPTSGPASGPRFKPAPPPAVGKALVYLFRPANRILGDRDAYFYVDKVHAVNLSTDGYTQFSLDPGLYELEQKWPADMGYKNLTATMRVEAGKIYFYRFAVEDDFGVSCPVGKRCFKWSIYRVNEETSRYELGKCHLQPAKI